MNVRSETEIRSLRMATQDPRLISELQCPYCDSKVSICSASISAVSLADVPRQEYCYSDGFDNCPIFLAKILRMR